MAKAKKRSKSKAKSRPATKRKPKQKLAGKASHLRQSKTEDFVERLKNNNSMVEYFTRLRILNPAAQLMSTGEQPRREGSFVRLAHANEEFTAPVLTKGKAFLAAQKEAAARRRKKRTDDK